MKANAPEKSYADVRDNLSDSILYGFTEKSRDEAEDTRTVAFIDKAADYIFNNMRLIDKDPFSSGNRELEKINQEYKKTWKWKFKWFYRTIIGRLEVLEGLKNYINTFPDKDKYWLSYSCQFIRRSGFEVKEVDLEKEVEFYWKQCDLTWCKDAYTMSHIRAMLPDIAEHFFELGLKAKG